VILGNSQPLSPRYVTATQWSIPASDTLWCSLEGTLQSDVSRAGSSWAHLQFGLHHPRSCTCAKVCFLVSLFLTRSRGRLSVSVTRRYPHTSQENAVNSTSTERPTKSGTRHRARTHMHTLSSVPLFTAEFTILITTRHNIFDCNGISQLPNEPTKFSYRLMRPRS
jgi:hypothetical protein